MSAPQTLAEKGWAYVRLIGYRQNTKGLMWRHNAVYAPPPRRWTFGGYGVLRTHEHYFNRGR